jgi:hypothetical protein
MLLTSLTSLDLSGVRFHQFNGVSCLERLFKLNKLMLKECSGDRTTLLTRLKSLTIDGEVCNMKKGLGHLFKSKSATM